MYPHHAIDVQRSFAARKFMPFKNLSLDIDTLTDTEGASTLLAVPAATLIKWRSTGEVRIPFVRIGRQIKYRTRDLKLFIESSTVK
jgi:hypothetical protein